MSDNTAIVPAALHKDFESIKKVDPQGYEYWEARELMPLLGYATWEKFYQAITRALVTCQSTGQTVADHFRAAAKMVKIGSKTRRKIVDYHLSRLACYLTAQNGDPRKPEIAFAQTYFAVQTRKQEIFQSMDDDGKRLFTRQQVLSHNRQLSDTAKKAGVDNFGKFHNAGYLGLYGLKAEDIKRKKGIGSDDILDRAGSTELAANLFRITQTDAKLKKATQVLGENMASRTHYEVGKQVRESIRQIGGTMPEELPPEEHIEQLFKRKVGQLPAATKKVEPKRLKGKK